MTAGIWLLFYDIGAADRDHYVDWFHRRHIPEKLARPGYRWAAHFEAPAGPDNTDLYHYIGMFGGDSTKVFLDPSPAQLKLTQSDETRAMMARRQNPSSAILAHEWSWFSPADAHAGTASDMPCAGINAPHIQILTIEGPAHDEMIGSACAQKLAPGFVRHRILRQAFRLGESWADCFLPSGKGRCNARLHGLPRLPKPPGRLHVWHPLPRTLRHNWS